MSQTAAVPHLKSARPPFWKDPVVILIAGSLSSLLAFGFRNSFGVLLEPMTTDLGWARQTLSLSLAIQNLMWGVSQPIAGLIAERYGSGRVVFGCGLIYLLGLFGSTMIFSPVEAHAYAGVLIGIGLGGTSNGVILAIVGRAFPPEKRSMALGIVTGAASGGQVLLVPFAAYSLQSGGWQGVLYIFVFVALIFLALSLFLTGKPAPSAVQNADGTMAADQKPGDALIEALTNRNYLLLVAGFFVCGYQLTFIGLHLPAYLVGKGFDATVGGWAIALIGVTNIIGSITAGFLGTRRSKKSLLAYIYLGRSVAIAGLLFLPLSEFTVYGFAAVMGFLWLSTVPLTSGLIGQIFGVRYMATLFGIVFLSHQVGSFLGAWMGGYLYDLTNSYDLVWFIAIGLGVFAAAVHWPIREKPLPRVAALG